MGQKTVLITGAGTGIGLACVHRFLKEGWGVVAHFNSSSKELELLLKQKPGKNLKLMQCDFNQRAGLEKFIKNLRNVKVDALVNNAASYDLSRQSKDRFKDIENILRVNMVAPALIAEAVLEGMKKNKGGSIVNVSSIGVKYGSNVQNVFYGMSKGGLEALTRSLAREGAGYNVLVNTVRPGVTDTPFHQRIGKDLKQRAAMIPLKRLAQPAEIAETVFFLCSQNTFITSEIITVAGGE